MGLAFGSYPDTKCCWQEVQDGPECGARAWSVYDQGQGLVNYDCENGHAFSIQYEWDEDEADYCEELDYEDDLYNEDDY